MSVGAAADSARDPHQRPRELGSSGLISHCAHALRTPLNAILGFAQILALDRDQPLTALQKERADQIQVAGWQLLRMIDDVVELARIAAGRLSVSMGPVTVGPTLRDSLARLGTQAGPDRVHLEAGPGLEATAWADRDRLGQIVSNLILAALQCNRRDPVRVGGRSQVDGGATIWIQGTAPSMTSEQLEQMFLPLDHLAPGDLPGPNVQVSLALTQKLVELIGGRLRVRRDADSRFELGLRLSGAETDGAAPRLADAA
jgi:signal transduction histidine kinase